MPKMTTSYIVCKDWEWVEFGDWDHIATNKDWEWVEFGDWKIGDILHPPTNNHTDNKGKQKLKK